MLPPFIHIGGLSLQLILTPNLTDENGSIYGQFSSQHLSIELDSARPPAVIARTFLHEILHACVNIHGVHNTEYKNSDAFEEAIITAIELQFSTFLLAHPWFHDWFQASHSK